MGTNKWRLTESHLFLYYEPDHSFPFTAIQDESISRALNSMVFMKLQPILGVTASYQVYPAVVNSGFTHTNDTATAMNQQAHGLFWAIPAQTKQRFIDVEVLTTNLEIIHSSLFMKHEFMN